MKRVKSERKGRAILIARELRKYSANELCDCEGLKCTTTVATRV
jgi:hypothetical protein